MSHDRIRAHFTEAADVLARFLADPANLVAVEQAAAFMSYCLKQGAKVISCGNGGSMCDAMHFAEELTGRYRDDRPPIAALSISDPSHLTCVGNDHGFEQVFARFVQAHGREGDVLLAISTSGNSPNVLAGLQAANDKGCITSSWTAEGGGKAAEIADIAFKAPSPITAHAQECHMIAGHIICDAVDQAFAG